MRGTRLGVRWDSGVGFFAALVGLASCGDGTTKSPFGPDAGMNEGGAGGAGGEAGVLPPPMEDPTLGGPCTDDGQCDDGFECTTERCDLVAGRCRFSPDDRRCLDDVYCDGAERCMIGVGCTEAEPVSCSDNTTCTIDRCVEATKSCEHRGRDADGDGDSVWNCEGGSDCDDTNARVSGTTAEICDNDRDDDCDGDIDERTCSSPVYDSCVDPLIVEASGSYELSLAAATEDYALSCAESSGTRRDVVAALVIPDGPPVDVDLAVAAERGAIALAVFSECRDPESEQMCAEGVRRLSASGTVARTVLRAVEPGSYAVIVSGVQDDTATLEVKYDAVLPEPENETCALAAPLVPGESVELTLATAQRDVASACGVALGDTLFRFELEEQKDVELSVAPLDDRGTPIVSLRDAGCTELSAELTCRTGGPSVLFARALPAGVYYAAVGSTGPQDVAVRLELFEPTDPPAGEGCTAPPEIELGRTQELDLAHRADAVRTECGIGAPDATYALTLDEPSDVLLVQRVSAQDQGAISLLGPECAPSTRRVCAVGPAGPLRARAYAVPEGEYRVVAESQLGSPLTLGVFSRPARPTVLVGLSDYCDDATRIDEAGGRFVGNTNNARADVEASCDYGGTPAGGAPEQFLTLHLSRPRRVIFDMEESSYATLLVIRHTDACPGPEVPGACVPGFVGARSFLDITLSAGEYRVQVDGYNQESGAWTLDVFTADP